MVMWLSFDSYVKVTCDYSVHVDESDELPSQYCTLLLVFDCGICRTGLLLTGNGTASMTSQFPRWILHSLPLPLHLTPSPPSLPSPTLPSQHLYTFILLTRLFSSSHLPSRSQRKILSRRLVVLTPGRVPTTPLCMPGEQDHTTRLFRGWMISLSATVSACKLW